MENLSIHDSSQHTKFLSINFTKDVKDPCNENFNMFINKLNKISNDAETLREENTTGHGHWQ